MSERTGIIDDLHELLDRKPFRPFAIVLNSGERYKITWNHQVAVSRDALIVLPPEATSVYMRSSQINSLEVLEPA